MLIQKSFSQKSTKLYIIMIITSLLIILLLESIIAYCQNISASIITKNNLYYMISEENYINKLQKLKFLQDIEEGIILENTRKNIDKEINIEEIAITFEEDKVLIFDNESNLSFNEISITSKSEKLDLESLIGKTITFNYNNSVIELIIKEINYANIPNIKISNELFDKLYNEKKLNVYKLIPNDKNEITKIKDIFKDAKNNKLNIGSISYYENSEDKEIKNEEYYQSLIKTLSITIICLMFLFLLIFIIISVNIFVDETKINNIRKYLGYENINLTLNIIINYVILFIISIMMASIIFKIITMILNYILKICLAMPSIFNLIVTYITIIIIITVIVITGNTIKVVKKE